MSKSVFKESNDNRQPLCCVQYQAEEVRNCSPDPDSWFSVQTKGEENTNRRGNIHVENAAAQALRGFSGFNYTGDKENRWKNANNKEERMRAEDCPLMGVFTNGCVSVEIVS